jgi:sec-independent protein translocase protein TatC
MADQEMPVMEHLAELRKRIILALVPVVAGAGGIYFFIPSLIKYFTKPLTSFKLKLVYFSITEGFTTRVKLSLAMSIIIFSPFILYQLIAFIRPGLTAKERKIVFRGLIYLAVFFLAGVAVGYGLIFPKLLKFLIKFGTHYMTPVFSGNTYFSFLLMAGLITGVTFIIPLLIIILGKLGLVSYRFLKKGRKFVVLLGALLAGSIAPLTDIPTFLILLLPILILYEISVWVVYLIEKRNAKTDSASAVFEETD